MTVKLNVIAIATSAAWLVAPPATRSLAAQPNSAVDPVITHMRALGLDSSRTRELAQALFDSLGPRLTGSPDIARAQNWLLQQYRSWGIDARNEPYGTWRGWRRGYSHIDLIEPRVRSLDGVMVAFSPGTNGKVLSAGTIILPRFHDSTAFVQWLPAARGKLVLASAPRSSCRPSDDWARNATPASKARNDSARAELAREWGGRDVRGSGYSLALGGGELGLRLEAGGAAGLITSRPKDSRGAREIFETYNVRTPTISLGCEDYGLVFRLTEANQQPRLRLDLDAELLGERPVFNTIATIRGTEKPDEYVLLSAHFDSWDGGSGATDNGTGTLTVLEAMRILRRAYPKPRRTIVVGHWSGEEVGLVGSRAFSEDHPEIIRGLHALFNQDNGTGRIQSMKWGRAGGDGWPCAAVALKGARGVPEPDHVQRGSAVRRRERRRLVRLLRRACLRIGSGELGLRFLYVAHGARYLRQSRVRRTERQRHDHGDARLPGLRGSGAAVTRASRSRAKLASVRQGAAVNESATQVAGPRGTAAGRNGMFSLRRGPQSPRRSRSKI